MKIECNEKNVSELLKMGFFKIPRFQRPYSWQLGEVEEFWNDTIASSDREYFIGSVVLFKSRGDTFGVVDGQQRLTTITMVLCALRNTFKKYSLDELSKGIHTLIERPDIDHKNQYVLQTETSYPYLQEFIQSFDTPDASTSDSQEERNLRVAFSFITDNIQATLDSIKNDKTVPSEKAERILREKLIGIREKVLSLKLIFIALDSEEDAYIIFETLNTRGRDLKVADLFRTHLTKLLPNKNHNVDRPKDRFNQIVNKIENDSEQDISMSTFLHHQWLSCYDYTTEKKIFKELKKTVSNKDDAKIFLDELEYDSDIYQIIHSPGSKKWRIEELALQDALKALLIFRVKQQMPFILSVIREYLKRQIKLKVAIKALKAVENFHFIFTAVTSQRSSGGIAFMYALHARELKNAKSDLERVATIEKLIKKLHSKLPSYDEFLTNFKDILYSEKHTKKKELVKYILSRFSQHYLVGSKLDLIRMTIEHLGPQSGKSNIPENTAAMLGNLILVDTDLNQKLGVKPFSEKKKMLIGNQIWIDDQIKKATSWTEQTIVLRTEDLASKAFNEVWKISR